MHAYRSIHCSWLTFEVSCMIFHAWLALDDSFCWRKRQNLNALVYAIHSNSNIVIRWIFFYLFILCKNRWISIHKSKTIVKKWCFFLFSLWYGLCCDVRWRCDEINFQEFEINKNLSARLQNQNSFFFSSIRSICTAHAIGFRNSGRFPYFFDDNWHFFFSFCFISFRFTEGFVFYQRTSGIYLHVRMCIFIWFRTYKNKIKYFTAFP